MKCSRCDNEASYTDSVPDPINSKQGEQSYKIIYLCFAHAEETRMYVGNTARLEKIIYEHGDELTLEEFMKGALG